MTQVYLYVLKDREEGLAIQPPIVRGSIKECMEGIPEDRWHLYVCTMYPVNRKLGPENHRKFLERIYSTNPRRPENPSWHQRGG